MVIRSWRRVMKIERRIYQIEVEPGKFWPIPFVSNGVAWRTMGYFAALFASMWILSRMVVIGPLLVALDPFSGGGRYIIFPGVLTWIMVNKTFEGRHPHRWLWDALRFAFRAKRTSAGRKVPDRVSWSGKVSVAHDEFSPDLHGARIHGPAVVRFNVPVLTRWGWRRNLVATGDDGGKRAVCAVGHRLDVRP